MRGRVFTPIPVTLPAGVSGDARLLAAWEGRPNPPVEGVLTVRMARRRLIDLRAAGVPS